MYSDSRETMLNCTTWTLVISHTLLFTCADDYNGLDWPTRYKIIKGTCDGLEYLHGQNPPFCHLNIKPDNILLDKYMEPKLSDGLSRLFHREVSRNTVLAKTTV